MGTKQKTILGICLIALSLIILVWFFLGEDSSERTLIVPEEIEKEEPLNDGGKTEEAIAKTADDVKSEIHYEIHDEYFEYVDAASYVEELEKFLKEYGFYVEGSTIWSDGWFEINFEDEFYRFAVQLIMKDGRTCYIHCIANRNGTFTFAMN